LLLGNGVVMLPVAVLLGCKSKSSKASLQGMRKSMEMSGKQEKRPRGNPSALLR